ncbi:hypothetical protein [Psychromonas sp. KJ10-2]|uniref:hypothetical protein n=1 Tax=Psychromonas sp. KJ10-2 TaxID=3391822 RepID=UPI0039B6E05B
MNYFTSQLELNTKAGVPLIQIVSHDTLRIHATCIDLSNVLDRNLFIWNRISGLENIASESRLNLDLEAVLDWYLSENDESDEFSENCNDDPTNSILLLEDIHYELEAINPNLFSKLRLYSKKKSLGNYPNQTILMSQPTQAFPLELEKDMQVMSLPLPNRDELKTLMEHAKNHYDLDDRDFEPTAKLIDAALGLSTSEAQLAFAKVAVEKQRLTESEIDLIVSEKEQVIKKSGLLEYFHPQVGLRDVGGLNNLKGWLERRKNAFSEDAQEYGLEYPRGILMLGLHGTGKVLLLKPYQVIGNCHC